LRAGQQRAGEELIMITLQYIENSLYNGELWAAMRNGRYWRLRRNGKTQTWKTRAGDYRTPVKAGLRSCGEITHRSIVALITDANWRDADFVVSASDPSK
jgi:hypothetical protein